MNIVFFGSDDFAVVSLDEILRSGHGILACVTPPDRPQGRGLKIQASPVKLWAEFHKKPILQPEDLTDKDFRAQLRAYKADLFVVIAYGKFLPLDLLQMPPLFAVNVHGSLLPKYRGAAPINWAIVKGDLETGVSIIKMNERMDAGDILAQNRIEIEAADTASTLRAKLASLGAKLLVRTMNSIEANTHILIPQDSNAVTFAPKLTKELGRIDWTKPAGEIYNLVRGLLPWPAAYTLYQGKTVKILKVQVVYQVGAMGEVLSITPEGILVGTGKHSLLVEQVHPESGKPMDAKSFAAGYRITKGVHFG